MKYTEIAPAKYLSILSLFSPLDFNLVVRSVASGNTPAWVFADDPAHPRTALIWDRQDAILVAGAADTEAIEALREIIFERIAPDARARGIPYLALLGTPVWDGLVPAMLPDLSPQKARRFSFRLDPEDFCPPPEIAGDFKLARIDSFLLVSRLTHLDEMEGWIESFWHSPQDFLQTGYGYCAIAGDAIAAWCLTVFAAGSARELGLATIPVFRKRGLATQVAAACLEHGIANKHTLHWHCWAENRPSVRVAEKLGFHIEREYSVYHLQL
jgi:RimJ/RimL family protein N-acetyltransferase